MACDNPVDGYIYCCSVIRDIPLTARRPVKIGYVKSSSSRWPDGRPDRWIGLTKRLQALQSGAYEELNFVAASEEFVGVNIVEEHLHAKYRRYHIRGEWFNLTWRQVCVIKKILKTHYLLYR